MDVDLQRMCNDKGVYPLKCLFCCALAKPHISITQTLSQAFSIRYTFNDAH